MEVENPCQTLMEILGEIYAIFFKFGGKFMIFLNYSIGNCGFNLMGKTLWKMHDKNSPTGL